MNEGGHRENGRHGSDMYKPVYSQWLMQQPQSMKHIMSFMAERDAAIQERSMAINEKNKACEERDLAIMQRDTVIQERNEAIIERDNALAALQCQQTSVNSKNTYPPECQISRGVKHMHHPQQHVQHSPHGGEASYDGRDIPVLETLPLASVPVENVKFRKFKRPKDPNAMSPNKAAKPRQKAKRENDDLNKIMFSKPQEWKGMQDMGGDESDDGYKQLRGSKPEWKGPDPRFSQVAFDESTTQPPVCSCTGIYRQCYKWGNGGWQSSCCTTTMSMYPLPAMPNKRHARVGGRKMSRSAFSKLLSRLAAEGHDLSTPVDLNDHWAKHGTNRYITIR